MRWDTQHHAQTEAGNEKILISLEHYSSVISTLYFCSARLFVLLLKPNVGQSACSDGRQIANQLSYHQSIIIIVYLEYFSGKSQVRFPGVRFLGWDFHCNFPEKYSSMFACQDILPGRIISQICINTRARFYQLRKSAQLCESRDENQTTHAN